MPDPSPHFNTVEIPDGVHDCFTRFGWKPESAWFIVPTRLENDGTLATSWLAAGDEGLFVVSANGTSRSFVWSDIKELGTEPVNNGGILWAIQDAGPVELIRFVAADAPLFGTLASSVNRELEIRRDSKGAVGDVRGEAARAIEKHRERYCASCGRSLPRGTKICRTCLPRASTLRRILSFSLPYKRQLILMAGLMVGGSLIQLIPPQITRVLVDDVLLSPGRAGLLGWLVSLLALVLIAQHAVNIWRARIGIRIGCLVTNDIQGAAFNHLQSLSMAYFNRQQTGALMSRINSDARQMQGFLVEGLQFTVVNLLTIVGVAAVLLWMNPFLGFLVLLPSPLVVLLSVVVWRRIHRRFRLLWVAMSAVSSYLNDALSGVRVIKAFGREDAERGRFARRLATARERTIAAEQIWQTLTPILNLLVQSSLVLVWYFGAWEVYGDRMTTGELIAYIGYLALIFGPLQLLTRLNDWLTRSLTAAARVFEILDTENEVIEREDAKPISNCVGNIELRNVSFGYDKHQPVLKQLSLHIQAGAMTGIVGKSGAGKSTFINLLGRLYDVDEGAVLLDGVDVRELCVADLRRHVGYVLQEPFLFSGSVADNIAYARPESDAEAVMEAAIAANAHDFIMRLSEGYDTYVGERGARLSGGERQRIAIARALLQDPKILILDEATSSVDTETEQKIQEALARLVAGRTTIAIAHRLSTLRHAGKLVVLDDGHLVEEGSHEELMRIEGGVYRQLVEIQTEWNSTIAIGG